LNSADIYTAAGPTDPLESTLVDNEDDVTITIVACGVDGFVYVDIANDDEIDLVDLKLDMIDVTVVQSDPNGNTSTAIQTS
jgi:hypothetical protein